MSKPYYPWWPKALNVIRLYPRLKAEFEDLHSARVTPSYSGATSSHSGINRSSEELALRELPAGSQMYYDAVTNALAFTAMLKDGEERLTFIKGYHFKQRWARIKDASYSLHVSESTLNRWHKAFVKKVGENLGEIL